MRRRVKIVCTLGPATERTEQIRALAEAGMDVVRLNFSHGTHAGHRRAILRVRQVSRDLGRPLPLLADLSGPKIRVGEIPGGSRTLLEGETVVLCGRLHPPGDGTIGTTYRRLAADLSAGDRVFLDDGRLRLQVLRVRGDQVHCRVHEGGELCSHKGINLPGVALSVPALTPKDRADLQFALGLGVDLVALSFVRSAADVRQAVRLLRQGSPGSGDEDRPPFAEPHPPLIAKLEKPQALELLEEILHASGGVMVARGDLGVEIEPERVPPEQKRIIRTANRLGRPVITATQMLESMTERSRPTRAEASDVANAVLDGTDAVMLSAETASGRYPVEAVRMMDRIIQEAEAVVTGFTAPVPEAGGVSPEEAVSRAAVTLADSLGAAAIVAFTSSGSTALRLARLRPVTPIVAFSPDARVVRRLGMVWGVTPRVMPRARRLSVLAARCDRALADLQIARQGDRVVLAMGYPPGRMGRTDLVKVHTVGESN